MWKAKFEDDTAHVKVTVFGEQAEKILGISAVDAERLERECIQMNDESRSRQKNAIRSAFEKMFVLCVELKEIGETGSPQVGVTAYSVDEVMPVSNDAKRARVFATIWFQVSLYIGIIA